MAHEALEVHTGKRCELVDVTEGVGAAVGRLGLISGLVLVFSPHTTAAVTVNEGADPSVRSDLLAYLDRAVPRDGPYGHAEGNSDAHIKVSLVGPRNC